MKSQTAALATIATLALWAASAGLAVAQAPDCGSAPEAVVPEARSGGAAGPGAPRREGHAPAEAAPAEPEAEDAPPVAGGSCPDQRRKLELIV